MRIATLGPTGSNHEFVLQAYLHERRASGVEIRLEPDFLRAFDALMTHEVDFVLQCSAHPMHAECVGRYMYRAFPVDTFVASSKPLALLARTDRPQPRTVGLQPATRHYLPLDGLEPIAQATTVDVAAGLLAGRFDAGICALEALEHHPDALRLVAPIGPAIDVWVLYGRERLGSDPALNLDAPVARRLAAA